MISASKRTKMFAILNKKIMEHDSLLHNKTLFTYPHGVEKLKIVFSKNFSIKFVANIFLMWFLRCC